MGKIVLDSTLRAKLNGLNEKMDVCDENDQQVGVFLPKAEYLELLYASIEIPFSEEEIERRRNAGGGCSLEEIWARLEKEHNVKIRS
jgi:hypothetical protein